MEQGPDEPSDHTMAGVSPEEEPRRASESGYQQGGDAEESESLDDTAVQRPPTDS